MSRPGRVALEALAAAACGAALALCLPKPGLCFLGWFVLAPLFLFYRKASPKQAAALGLCAGFGFHGLAFYWIYSTCRFAQTPLVVAWLAWGALALFLALNWALIGALGVRTAERLPSWARPFGWALAWTAATAAWEHWTPRPCGDLLEYTQWRHLALIQMAAVFGPHGLGFLVAFVNAALAEVPGIHVFYEPNVKNVNARHLVLPLVLVAVAWGWGESVLLSRPRGGPAVSVEILQPDIDQYQKWNPNSANDIDAGFAQLLSQPRTQKPDLIVWPESAIPRLVDEGQGVGEAALGSQQGATQLVGVVSRHGAELFNAAELLGPSGDLRGVYHKRELVPFGEYVPLSSLLRPMIGALDQIGEISAGAERQPLLDTPVGPAAATICYEAVFPRWMRLDASRGARVIFNLTNDGWYEDTWGPYQHFQTNVFRAIENRVTVVRAGNTGISAVIDPWGVVTARLDLGARGRLDAAVPRQDFFSERSFYARHGDWFGNLCLIALCVMMAQTMRPLARRR